MTHSPPIPAGNQSPYPLHEAPHDHRPKAVARQATNSAPVPAASRGVTAATLAIGAALGLGALAVVAALLERGRPAPAKTKRKRKRGA